jgi:hypothetical protein
MGRLIKMKKLGKNIRIGLYYFQDGYRIYPMRRDNNEGVDSWVTSQATSYPIKDLKEAIKELNEYKTIRDVIYLHPVLQDEGTWAVRKYNYKLEK